MLPQRRLAHIGNFSSKRRPALSGAGPGTGECSQSERGGRVDLLPVRLDAGDRRGPRHRRTDQWFAVRTGNTRMIELLAVVTPMKWSVG